MAMSQSIQLTQLNQTAQSGGYWLISGVLDQPLESLCAFYTLNTERANNQTQQACSESSHSTVSLSLFDYQHPTLKLLSKQPLSDALIEQGNLTIQAQAQSALDFSHDQTTLFVASDLGIGPLFYVAKQLKNSGHKHLALLHASQGFAFAVKPAQIMLADFPDEAIGGCSLLEDWKIANRLASDLGLPGCLDGSLTELITPWLNAENHRQLEQPLQWQLLHFEGSENTENTENKQDAPQNLQAIVAKVPWLTYQVFRNLP